jgi:excinuclease ABC subunit C
VLLRDDKSFPYILITGDHGRRRFSSIAARGRARATISAPSPRPAPSAAPSTHCSAPSWCTCTDSVYESRTRPCLLYQIKRCSGPCTGEIDFPGYAELVREAKDFLSGRSRR